MNPKIILGLILGFFIGLGCSLLNIPVPAPPVLVGALLVVAMSTGYTVTDRYVSAKSRPKNNLSHCAGPIGEPGSKGEVK